MYAYSNNGLSFRAWNDPQNLAPGEVYFDHLATPEELAGAFPQYAAALALEAVQRQFETLLEGGVTITSIGTPALNGLYAVDASAQSNISGIAGGIGARNRLPGGGPTFNYGDAEGQLHEFSSTNFLNFASVVEDFCYAAYQALTTALGGGEWTPPSANLTIL